MCYSYEASLRAFFINFLLCMILIQSPNIELHIIAYFFLFVSIMQLFDAYFWKHTKNKTATKLAMIFNHAQPLVLVLLVLLYKQKINESTKQVVLLYLVIILIYSYKVWPTLKNTRVTEDSEGSLNWKWNHGPYSEGVYLVFLLALVVLFYNEFSNPTNIIGASIAILTFTVSVLTYLKIQSVGRFWCYVAAFVPLAFLSQF
jgi:hypothetical protein